jgi:hypothetical protein
MAAVTALIVPLAPLLRAGLAPASAGGA